MKWATIWMRMRVILAWPVLLVLDSLAALCGDKWKLLREESNEALAEAWRGE